MPIRTLPDTSSDGPVPVTWGSSPRPATAPSEQRGTAIGRQGDAHAVADDHDRLRPFTGADLLDAAASPKLSSAEVHKLVVKRCSAAVPSGLSW